MKNTVLVNNDGVICCSRLEDGGIEKILLRSVDRIIYVCEECEATWLSLDGIFTEKDATAFEPYLESLGLIVEDVPPDWKYVIEILGFVCIDDVRHLIDKYGITVSYFSL